MIDFIKRNRVKIIIAAVSVVILTAAFVLGGGGAGASRQYRGACYGNRSADRVTNRNTVT